MKEQYSDKVDRLHIACARWGKKKSFLRANNKGLTGEEKKKKKKPKSRGKILAPKWMLSFGKI